MPYRLHATKRSLYKLAAEKIANLPWCELPKMSDVLFEHIRTSYGSAGRITRFTLRPSFPAHRC